MPQQWALCSGPVFAEIPKELPAKLSNTDVAATVRVGEICVDFYTYACKECPENGDNVTVVEAPRPKQVIAGGFASPEAIAHIMTQKFVMGSPLYRQEQEFHRHGL